MRNKKGRVLSFILAASMIVQSCPANVFASEDTGEGALITEAPAEAGAQTKAEAETKAEEETKAEAETKVEAETKAEAETQAAAETQTEADTQEEAETQAQTEADEQEEADTPNIDTDDPDDGAPASEPQDDSETQDGEDSEEVVSEETGAESEEDAASNIVSFVYDADQALVAVDGEEIEDAAAVAKDGVLVFTATALKGYRIDSVVVGEDTPVGTTENEDEYIIEGIENDNTVVTITTSKALEDTILEERITTAGGVDVIARYSADTFEEEVKMIVADVRLSDEQKDFLLNNGLNPYSSVSVDITFVNEDGKELQPVKGKTVSIQIAAPELIESAVETADATGEEAALSVVHTDDAGASELLGEFAVATEREAALEALGEEVAEAEEVTLSEQEVVPFEASSFSTYTVAEDGFLLDLLNSALDSGDTDINIVMTDDDDQLTTNAGGYEAKEIPAGVSVTIDLNGKTASNSNGVETNWFRVNGGSLTIKNGTITGGNNTKNADGIIKFEGDGASLALEGCTFDGNESSTDCAVLHVQSGDDASSITINNSTFSNNISNTGSAVLTDGAFKGTITIKGESVFENNEARTWLGGAIANHGADSKLVIEQGEFRNNKSENSGGAIFSDGNLTIGTKGCSKDAVVFDSNTSNYNGGAIYAEGGDVVIYNGTFTNNRVTGNAPSDNARGGGAIRTGMPRSFTLYDGYFDSNRTDCGGGGAIKSGNYDYNGRTTVDLILGGTFTNNSSHGEGGALSIGANHYALVQATDNGDIVFSGNRQTGSNDWGGGAIFVADGGTCKVVDSVIYNNSAGGYGGGIGGCSTGRIIADAKGTALFNNSAAGSNLSDPDNIKTEDRIYTSNDTVFQENGYQDYFCALQSTVFDQMLGGGSENWSGSADGAVVNSKDADPLSAEYVMGLTASPSQADIDKAMGQAHVLIYGNSANVHGGGVMCNGVILFGKEIPRTIEMPSRFMIAASKQVMEGENLLDHESFLFWLYDEDFNRLGNPIWSYSDNDNAQNGTAYTIVSYENSVEPGEYIYYLAEDPTYLKSLYNLDKTVYRITVQVTKEQKIYTFTDIGENGEVEKTETTITYPDINITKAEKGKYTDSVEDASGFTELEKQDFEGINRYDDQTHYADGDYYYINEGENHASELSLFPVMKIPYGAFRKEKDTPAEVSHPNFENASFVNTKKSVPMTEIQLQKKLQGKSLNTGDFSFTIEADTDASTNDTVYMPQAVEINSVEYAGGNVILSATKMNSQLDQKYVVKPEFTLTSASGESYDVTVAEPKSASGWDLTASIPVGSISDGGYEQTFILQEKEKGSAYDGRIQYDSSYYEITVKLVPDQETVRSSFDVKSLPIGTEAVVYNKGTSINSWPIRYIKPGTYVYKVTENLPVEVSGDEKIIDGVKYDTSTKTVTVIVEEKADSSPEAEEFENLEITSVEYADDDKTFTNEYIPDRGGFKVVKTVEGVENGDKEFKFTVKSGTKYLQNLTGFLGNDPHPFSIKAGENNAVEFTDLPIGAYVVEELTDDAGITGYIFVEEDSQVKGTVTVEKDKPGEIELKNKYESSKYDLEVVKQWQGIDDTDASKDDLTLKVKLQRTTKDPETAADADWLDVDGQKDIELNKANGWSYAVKNMDQMDANGNPYSYKWVETEVPDKWEVGPAQTVQKEEQNLTIVTTLVNRYKEEPHKKETAPDEGIGELCAVNPGDVITYEISYRNYKFDKADVVIKDTLDKNVEFVSASDDGKEENGVVTWTLPNVEAGKKGTVELKVKVLEGAQKSNGGSGKVVNGGDGTKVKVGNDNEYTVKPVENPVPEEPEKKETAPYEGTGELGAVKVGDVITYTISYENYKSTAADVVIKDTLDKNVEFVSASDDGKEAAGVVTWTLTKVEAGKKGTVELKVKVLEGAQKSNGGSGKVVNGGDGTTVKVDNDNEYTVETVENPVPEEPEKKAQLTLQKRFSGDDIPEEAKKAVTFTVKNKDTGKTVGTYTIGKDFDKDSSTGRYSKTIDVDPGTYEVTESSNAVSGYQVSVVYVADGKSGTGSAQVTLADGDRKTASVTNTYKKSGSTIGSSKGTNPKTGDDTPIGLYVTLLALALVLMSVVVIYRKKRRA